MSLKASKRWDTAPGLVDKFNVLFAAGEITRDLFCSSGVHNAVVCSCGGFLERTVNSGKIFSILRGRLQYSKRHVKRLQEDQNLLWSGQTRAGNSTPKMPTFWHLTSLKCCPFKSGQNEAFKTLFTGSPSPAFFIFLNQIPLVPRLLFRSSPLTESLEQARQAPSNRTAVRTKYKSFEPNWFKRRTLHVRYLIIRFGTGKVRRLNRTLINHG